MDNSTNQKQQENTQEQAAPQQEQATIMPTMIDESEERVEVKRDLSSIIPKFEEDIENPNSIELISKDNSLKSDGSVTLASINTECEIDISPNASIPVPIDLEERRKEAQKNKGKVKKEKVKNTSKSMQRFQNRAAFGSLIVMLLLGGFYYWYKNHPTEKDFTVLTVTVEIGNSLPIRTSSYVKPGVGKDVDELQYIVDKSKVILEEVGEYEFSVTYHGITKTGLIKIVDTTAPELEIREVTINEGDSYDAGSFVANCKDPSGCNYSFQDPDTPKKKNSPGMHEVYVVATDAYQNSVTKKANLIIEAVGVTYVFNKKTDFDFKNGYEVKEEYELRFSDNIDNPKLIKGTYQKIFKYQDEKVYEKARKTYSNEVNYACNDAQMTITYVEAVYIIGNNYSDLRDIDQYLRREGFTIS